ncbi:MAG: Transglycosylase-associated protein [Firmicutes bacterium]|nr:Transglycosylase-associated protein [Bacillota bacterium]
MLWFLIIGIIAGWLAGHVLKGSGFGLFGDLVVGVIGSFLGGYLFGFLGLTAHGTIGKIVMATIGAIVLLLVIRFFKQ